MTDTSRCGGIYFVVPFPSGWKVCAFRFDFYPDIGHALTWELLVAPQLALRWARTIYSATVLEQSPELVLRLKEALASYYDAVPRGRLVPPASSRGKYRLYHGDDLPPCAKIQRRTIATALKISGHAVWLRDEHETRNADSVEQLTQLLKL